MSLRKKFKTGVFWSFLQQFAGQIISFSVSVLLARLLLPREFGLLAMIIVFANISKLLIEGGLTQSLIRDKDNTNQDYSTIFYFNLVFSIFLYLILYISAPLISEFYSEPQLISIIRIYSLVLIISSFSMVQMARLTKAFEFKKQMLIFLPSQIIGGVIGLFLAYNNFGVWSLVYMTISERIFTALSVWVYSKWTPRFSEFSLKRLKHHFKFGINLTGVSLIHNLYINSYSLIIGKYFSPSILGFYEKANSTKNLLVNNISHSLDKVLYPLFAEIQDDNVRLKNIYRLVMTQVFFWLTPLLLFAMIFAYPLTEFVLTEKWLPMAPYFQILCIVGILTPVQKYNVNILKIKGRTDLFLKIEYIKKIIFFIGIFFSIKFGIYGLLINIVIMNFVALYINSYFSGKMIDYPLKEQIYNLSTTILTSIFTSLIIYYIYNFHIINLLSSNFLILIIGFLLFSILYILFNFLLKNHAINDFLKIISKNKKINNY